MGLRAWHEAALFLARGRLACLLVAATFSCMSLNASASGQEAVYFAGVAYTSNAINIDQAFPYVSKLLDKQGLVAINQSIHTSLQSEQLPEVVSFDSLGSIKDASRSVALALGLDGETTSTEHIGSVYKLRVEISAEALFFDFKEKQVLGGFPFIIDYITVLPEPPTDADVQKAFQGIVFGTDGMHSLSGVFATTLAHSTVPEASAKHLRVTSSTLGEKAIAYITKHAPQVDRSALRQEVAQAFGTYLAANQQISILPYTSNQALGSAMAARFIEGDSYDLKIPEADYEIHLNVAGFKKLVASHSSVATVYLYGAFADVTVLEPLSNHVYFSQRVKQGQTKTVPAAQTSQDDWPPTYDTLKTLFFNFTDSLTNQQNRWLKAGLPDDAQSRSQFSALGELIQSCR